MHPNDHRTSPPIAESEPSFRPRGDGRKRLEAAARDLLDEAQLGDLLRFVTVSALVERSGTSNGAIYACAQGPAALARRTVMEAAVDPGEPTTRLIAALLPLLERTRAGELLDRAEIAEALAANVFDWSVGSGRVEFTAALLSAAVACSDPEAAAAQKDFYDTTRSSYAPVIRALLEGWNREPIDNFDAASMALLFVSMGDGLALRARFDPAVTTELVEQAFLALWSGTSRAIGVADDNLDSRLLPNGGHPRATSTSTDDRDRIGEAVQTIYRQQGWPAVSVSAVMQRTGLSRGAVLAAFGDRDGLSVAIWQSFRPAVERLAAASTRMAPLPSVARLLTLIIERAQDHPTVTQSLLTSLHDSKRHDTTSRHQNRVPTRHVDAVEALGLQRLLSETLHRGRAAFRAGFVDSEAGASRLAGLLVDAALSTALDRSDDDPADLASYLTDVFLQGTLARRSRGGTVA